MSALNSLLVSHVVLTTSAFLLLFPLGALLVRLNLPLPLLRYHAPSQILALLLAISGVLIGFPLARLSGYSITGNAHAITGLTVVFGLLAFQPLGGWLQHRYYKRYGGRGMQGTLHVWFGRAMIVLGIVNGGLRLHTARDTSLEVRRAYIGVAAMVGVVYGAALGWNLWRTRSVRDVLAIPGRREEGEKDMMRDEYENEAA